MRQIAEHAEAIVDRHADHALFGELRTVVHRLASRSGTERAAVDPHDDRRGFGVLGRPDVERQAILAHRRIVFCIDAARARPGLNARRPRSDGHTSALQSLMLYSYPVFRLTNKT